MVDFSAGLRRLRRAAGSPSYRELAQRAHYSVSALSQAANGRSLPTLAVTLAFVTGCGGDPVEWERRWREVAAALAGTADQSIAAGPSPQATPPGELAPAAPSYDLAPPLSATPPAVPDPGGVEPPEPEPNHADTGPKPRKPVRAGRLRLVLTAATAAVLAAAALTWVAVNHHPTAAAPLAARPGAAGPDPIADGSDPNRAGCGPDAVTLAATLVHFPTDQYSGKIELRYSPHCQAAWGRFTPAPDWHPGPGVAVTVWTIRPADQASRQYTVPFGGETIIGDMLMTARGCIEAEVTMQQRELASPVATTPCWVFRSSEATPR